MKDKNLEDIVLENRSRTKLKSVSSSGTGSSSKIYQLIENQEPISQRLNLSVSSSTEGSSTEIDQVAGNQEPIVMEERSLAAARSQTKLKSVSGSAEGSSTKIDQLISDINLVSIDNISTLVLDGLKLRKVLQYYRKVLLWSLKRVNIVKTSRKILSSCHPVISLFYIVIMSS